MEPMLSLAFSRVHHLLRKCLRPPTRKTHPNTWSVSPPQWNQEMINMCLDDLSCENSHWKKCSFRNIVPLPRHNDILGQMNFSTPTKGGWTRFLNQEVWNQMVSKMFYFHPQTGEDSHFDEHMFQMGLVETTRQKTNRKKVPPSLGGLQKPGR